VGIIARGMRALVDYVSASRGHKRKKAKVRAPLTADHWKLRIIKEMQQNARIRERIQKGEL
jgi:hypothetical protein